MPCSSRTLRRAWSAILIAVAVLLLAAAPPSAGAAVDASSFGSRIDLSSGWLFAVGDNPAYALSTFDDSGWQRVLPHTDFPKSTPRFSYGWYRLHVQTRPDARDAALSIENISGSYEVFINGVRIGGYGAIPPRDHRFEAPVAVYRIPDRLIAQSGGTLVVALRFAVAPANLLSHGVVTPLGEEAKVSLATPVMVAHDASYEFAHVQIFNIGTAILFCLSGIFVLGLYFALRTQREYLALGISALAASAYVAAQVWVRYRYADHSHLGTLFTLLIWAIMSVANLEFVRLLVREPRGPLILTIQCATLLDVAFDQVYIFGGVWVTIALVAHLLMFIAGDAYVLVSLSRAWRRGNIDAQLIFPAWLATMIVDVYTLVSIGLRLGHLPLQLPDLPDLPIGSYALPVLTIINLIYTGALIVMVLLRTIRVARERAAVASEVAAAQTVQQVLLARASQPTPGFHVETVYQPASEVGGDFFFVSPGPEDSLTAVVGDVSGKGLLAAMRVSMILGVLRREDSDDPAEILVRLNEVLLTQGEMGFTTACCVRLDREGRYAIANAGHISPYVGGRELEALPSLPLGMVGGQGYDTLYGELGPGETLVLLSDGIVEARSADGELYGFDRAAALTLRPAREIAQTAIGFGQEDDITVLTIACAA